MEQAKLRLLPPSEPAPMAHGRLDSIAGASHGKPMRRAWGGAGKREELATTRRDKAARTVQLRKGRGGKGEMSTAAKTLFGFFRD
ncbi:hypothetical protein GUJ93_ZPchr0013g36761 [Zizania palustris]|uniref:Uncharacterized protein n=1 Tax=Zizania palustris TaxID=103762 RepID=A0A8J5X098_ZIZPA|nr:hypothetical protein GUJ93_ZPchr0013g36169 [Zizania palustris]KAG8096933.1 hypothetical protein GUJ93_ZPchr0013g36761 [Zizania palustris]